MRFATAVAALAATRFATAQAPGATAALSSTGANYLLSQLVPILEAKIGSITIPDLPFDKDGFEGSVSNIKCANFDIGANDIAFNPPSDIGIVLDGIAVTCSANWDFKLKSWPHEPKGSGTVDIDVSGTNGNVTVGITAVNLRPTLAVAAASLDVGSISLTFHGSLLDWILDLFKGMISDAVKDNLQSTFTSVITTFVTTDLNALLAAINLAIPIPAPPPFNITEARFGLVANPTVTSTYVGLALQGDVVLLSNPVQPPIPPPSLPPFSAADGDYYLTAYLSPYMLLSAVYAYSSVGLLTWPIAPSSIPLGFNTTAAYLLVAPGLPLAYPGAAVMVTASVSSLPNITMSGTGIATALPVSFAFSALASNGTWMPAFTLDCNTSLNLDLDINTTTAATPSITGELSYLDASVTLASSSVGPVSTSLLSALVNVTFADILLPIFNELLSHGLPLPSAPGLALTNATLLVGNGYTLVGADFTFNASTAAASASSWDTGRLLVAARGPVQLERRLGLRGLQNFKR